MSVPTSSKRLVPTGILLSLALAGGLSPWPAAAADDACVAAEPVSLNATFRKYRTESAGSDLLRLTVPSAGVLLLHGSSPAAGGAQPRLAFLGDRCTAGGGGYAVIQETPGELLLRIPASGTYFFTVSPEDPARPLAYYKLQTVFAAEPGWPDEVIPLAADPPGRCAADGLPSFTSEPLEQSRFVELRREAGLTKDVDPIDDDVVSGGLAAPGVVVVESPDSLQATLYAGTDCGPEDRRAEGALGNGGAFVAAPLPAGEYRLDLRLLWASSYTLGVKYFALCGRGEQDDHLDLPLCATPIATGSSESGVIGDAAGGDEDYFTFTVAAQETVKIIVRSEERVEVALYGEDGQRLASRDACPRGCAGRIVRTLGKGRYYVRVGSGDATGGDYTVSVALLGSP